MVGHGPARKAKVGLRARAALGSDRRTQAPVEGPPRLGAPGLGTARGPQGSEGGPLPWNLWPPIRKRKGEARGRLALATRGSEQTRHAKLTRGAARLGTLEVPSNWSGASQRGKLPWRLLGRGQRWQVKDRTGALPRRLCGRIKRSRRQFQGRLALAPLGSDQKWHARASRARHLGRSCAVPRGAGPSGGKQPHAP